MTQTTTPTMARLEQWFTYSDWSPLVIGLVVLFVSVLTSLVLCLAADMTHAPDAQAKLWECTLEPAYRESGKPWKAYHLTASYEAARKLTAERMQWADDAFTVSPCVKNYQDTLNVVYQP